MDIKTALSVVSIAISLLLVVRMAIHEYINFSNEKRSIQFQFRDLDVISNNQDVIALMFESVKELKEYYVISKSQAKSTFRIACASCIFGFIIYITGIISTLTLDKDIAMISIIAGTILEIISGTTFWLYSKALSQLNTYHRRLEETEKYLIAYQMIKEVPEEKRYEEQRNFISCVLNDNRVEQSDLNNSSD